MNIAAKQQFGEWTVETELQGNGRTCYLVRKGRGPLHVLKPCSKQSMPVGATKTEAKEHQTLSFQKEIEALKRLTDHPNIITIVDYEVESETPWHVTEYCSGGSVCRYKFEDWSIDDLKSNAIRDRLNDLAKAIGYANSKGIALGNDIEVFVTEDRRFIIGDLEAANIWDNHHIDTTDDIKAFTRIRDEIMRNADRIRRQKYKQRDRKRQVEHTLERAQPSAPRRLVTK